MYYKDITTTFSYFNTIDNVKYIVSGAGGRSHYSLTSTPQPIHYRDDSNYGFTLIDANFATYQLQGKFITNGGIDKSSSYFTQSFYRNSVPIADEQSVTVNKNGDKTIMLTGSDADNDFLTYSIMTQPLHGTISTGTGASHTYTPATNYVGPDSFTFKTNDGYIDSNIATVSITVQNGPPVANDLSITVNKNTQQSLSLTATDPNGDPLTYAIVTPPSHGMLSPAGTAGPSRTYTPTTGYEGPDSLSFKTNDGYIDSNIATVSITVQNGPPIANNQAITVNKNTPQSLSLTATDPNNDPLAYDIVTLPSHGTLSPAGAAGPSRTYTPTTGYEGPDSFTFKTNDGYIDSNTATVSITVQNGPPVANNQAITVNKNTQQALTLTATDPNNDPLAYDIVTLPSHGTLSPAGAAEPDPLLTYNPTTNYLGSDDFTFKANDGTVNSNTATVNINVIERPQVSYNYSPSFVATGSNYRDTPDSASLRLTQFSVATWFKTSADFATDSMMVNKGGLGTDSAGQNMNYGIWMTSAEKIRAGFETSSGTDQYITSANSYNDDRWHYVVVTNDGSNLRLYVDGVQVGTKSLLGASPENTGTKPVRIGANSRVTPSVNLFTGELDEVRIWNVGLTAQQVTSALAGTDFTASKQVLYLAFGGYIYSPGLALSGTNYQNNSDSASLRLTQFSVATWFKTSADYATDSIMVNKGGLGADSAGQNMNYGIWMTSAEKIRAGFETSSGTDQYITSANSYNDGRWHYVVVTSDGSTLRLYVDGVQVANKSLLGASPENTGTKPVRIGANSRVTPPGNIFTGELDEVRIWSAGLTAQQAASAFAGTDFTTSKQILYLDFTSVKLADKSKSDPGLIVLPGN